MPRWPREPAARFCLFWLHSKNKHSGRPIWRRHSKTAKTGEAVPVGPNRQQNVPSPGAVPRCATTPKGCREAVVCGWVVAQLATAVAVLTSHAYKPAYATPHPPSVKEAFCFVIFGCFISALAIIGPFLPYRPSSQSILDSYTGESATTT